MKAIALSIVFFILVSACSENEPADTKKVKSNNTKENVLKGYKDQLDKAKQTENEVLKKAEEKQKAIDDATGNN